MKKYSTSLAIREMQIKTMLRFHFTFQSGKLSSRKTNNKCRDVFVWGREELIHCW
jgi:hypothetical protein